MPIVAEAECTSTAASCKWVPRFRRARSNSSSASRSAESFLDAASKHLLLDLCERFCPSVFAKFQFLVGLHAVPLLILKAQAPTMLGANPIQTRLVLLVPGATDQSRDVFAPTDFAMYLRLLVLHLPNLRAISQQGIFAIDGHLDRFDKLRISVCVQHMGIVVEHRKLAGLEIGRILWRQGHPEPNVLQDHVGVTILSTSYNSTMIIHGINDPILTSLDRLRVIVEAAEELLFPLLTHLRIHQTARAGGFELVAVVGVLLQPLHHLVQVHVNDDRGLLTYPR
mmetsp:Transcript_23008/g.52768  ORF Transcript_23008/g.52768 Transcript_23008/m.52768 type:complete len:282 (-) Transcript_23008:925-1770(-)